MVRALVRSSQMNGCMENGLIRALINEIIRNESLSGIFGGKSTLN